VIQGPQTAFVVGTAGEEIDTDEFGRVKVQFHWDRYGKVDENSSCWVRVSQPWAGKGWGAINIPRIGQEVVVEFLEGDPDRPIITGRVYNASAKVPYELPANKTISSLKSNTSKGGGGFNEIRFEDKKGEEQVFIHAEKNVDTRVKNDAFEWIGNNRHLVVKKDQVEHVENNRSEIVDADHTEEIGKDRHLKVVGKEAKAVDESLSLTVKGDVIEVFKANHSEQTTADYYLKADNVVIEALTNLTLKVGSSSIAIEAGGIGIKTSGEIKIESTGTTDIKATAPLTVESSATAEMKSPATTVKGDGMLTLKGGVVMIN
jgi:type VI secretion system secreted protein VgrG